MTQFIKSRQKNPQKYSLKLDAVKTRRESRQPFGGGEGNAVVRKKSRSKNGRMQMIMIAIQM